MIKIKELILPLFGIWFLVLIIMIFLFTKIYIKRFSKVFKKDAERLKSRDNLKENLFTIVDIFIIEEKETETYVLISDKEYKTLYMYNSWVDEYNWNDNENYLEPKYYPNEEELYLLDNNDYNAYPLEFNKTGGKYKLVEEIGYFEAHDDKLYIYHNNEKNSIVKIKKIKHANKLNDINFIHNVKLIDCFIKYEIDDNNK